MAESAPSEDGSSSSSGALLEVEDLRTSFFTEEGEVRAVDGVSFELKRGRTLALVGESGCGKSVTAYSLLRLIQPPGKILGGSVRLRPRGGGPALDVLSLGERDPALYDLRGGRASLIFQEATAALSPVHTIGNQMLEAISLHQKLSRSGARRAAVEMLDRVGIDRPELCMRQYPHQLSGGMRQRAIIAMALVTDPELLIADEPTTALDVTIQAQVLALLKKLQRGLGTSILLITHDLAVVAQMADEVVVMYLGRVVERGSVRTILKKPRHPYTMGLIASLPSLTPVGQRLPSIEGSVPALTDVPAGCPFHPRCSYQKPGLCDRDAPPALEALRPPSLGPSSEPDPDSVPDESGPRESRPPSSRAASSDAPGSLSGLGHAVACHRVREIALERLLERTDVGDDALTSGVPSSLSPPPSAPEPSFPPLDELPGVGLVSGAPSVGESEAAAHERPSNLPASNEHAPDERGPDEVVADERVAGATQARDPADDPTESDWFDEGERISERPPEGEES